MKSFLLLSVFRFSFPFRSEQKKKRRKAKPLSLFPSSVLLSFTHRGQRRGQTGARWLLLLLVFVFVFVFVVFAGFLSFVFLLLSLSSFFLFFFLLLFLLRLGNPQQRAEHARRLPRRRALLPDHRADDEAQRGLVLEKAGAAVGEAEPGPPLGLQGEVVAVAVAVAAALAAVAISIVFIIRRVSASSFRPALLWELHGASRSLRRGGERPSRWQLDAMQLG